MTDSKTDNSLTVLFLCTGNTCRSPLAAALAQRKFGAGGFQAVSAGIRAVPGQSASSGSVLLAQEYGVSLTEHVSRMLTPELTRQVHWIIGMTRSHVAQLKRLLTDNPVKIGLLALPGVDLARADRTPDVEEVLDPFGGDADTYQRMASQLDHFLDGWRDTFTTTSAPEEER
ncbi:MAG: hypothetical protein ABIF77_06130 [bacterium]